MSKILKNTTVSDIELDALGYTIPASGQVNFDATEFQLLASDDVIAEMTPFLTSGDLVVNDGVQDLTLAEGLRFLVWPEKVQVKESGTDKLLYADKLNFIGPTVTDVGSGQADVNFTAAGDPFVNALFDEHCDPLFVKRANCTVELLEKC